MGFLHDPHRPEVTYIKAEVLRRETVDVREGSTMTAHPAHQPATCPKCKAVGDNTYSVV